MPAIYAHRVFGEAVINTLSHALADKLLDHLPLFQMGLHGPDLLFYYQPLFKTPLGRLGNLLHGCSGRQVIETMLKVTARTRGCPTRWALPATICWTAPATLMWSSW